MLKIVFPKAKAICQYNNKSRFMAWIKLVTLPENEKLCASKEMYAYLIFLVVFFQKFDNSFAIDLFVTIRRNNGIKLNLHSMQV